MLVVSNFPTSTLVCGLQSNVRVWTQKQKCLEALSEDREWRRCSYDVSRPVVPYHGATSCEWATSDCRSTDDGCMQGDQIRAGRAWSSSWWRHVCDASEASLLSCQLAKCILGMQTHDPHARERELLREHELYTPCTMDSSSLGASVVVCDRNHRAQPVTCVTQQQSHFATYFYSHSLLGHIACSHIVRRCGL